MPAALSCSSAAKRAEEGQTFRSTLRESASEAAVMVQNALDLKAEAWETDEEIPAWAEYALRAVEEAGLTLDADASLTRAEAAEIMYQVSGRITESTRYYS